MSLARISLYTIVRRETLRIFMIWRQTIIPPVVTTALYFLIFGAFIGSQLDHISGYSYVTFIAPGLIMMAVLTHSYMNVSASFYISKFQRSVEELLVSPTPNSVIIWGYVLGGVMRGLAVGICVTLVSMLFTALHVYNAFFLIAFFVLTCVFFSLGGLINAVYANSFDDISVIPSFVITPLTYLGGVFYSIDVLPAAWQTVSLLNPILYMVNGFRYGFLGVSDVNVWVGFWMLVVFCIVLYALTHWLLKKGIGLRT